MPIFAETTKPYEFLVRWNASGTLAGAHVSFRTITTKDGVVIADDPDAVQTVSVGGSAGFPLATILSQLQIDALTHVDALTTQLTAATAVAVAVASCAVSAVTWVCSAVAVAANAVAVASCVVSVSTWVSASICN